MVEEVRIINKEGLANKDINIIIKLIIIKIIIIKLIIIKIIIKAIIKALIKDNITKAFVILQKVIHLN